MTATSAITAAIAALALAACGPRDPSDATTLPGGATATSTSVASAATYSAPAVSPPSAPTTPVSPGTTTETAVVGAAPVDAPRPELRVADSSAPDARVSSYTSAPAVPLAQARPVDRSRIGAVTSIEPIRERPQGTGAGAVIGGVVGAVVGNQFGHGLGRAAMTGLGAAGGAVAGNNVERNHREGISGYRVRVRLDNGATRTFERTDVAGLQIGDRVHLDAHSFHRL
jgi:outer membrane lipoprotein SlyB